MRQAGHIVTTICKVAVGWMILLSGPDPARGL